MIYFFAAVALLGLDQWSKLWTLAHFAAPVSGSIVTADPARTLLGGLLQLTRLHNYGAAWGSFAGMKLLLVGVSILILTAIAVVAAKGFVRYWIGKSALCLLFAGGLGNLIDRLRLGYVVDMLQFAFWPSYPVFNVADICVVAGALLGGIYYMWYYQKHDVPRKEQSHGNDLTEG